MAKKRVLGVVGMGHVGAHVAYALAIQGIADELVLVDQNEQKLASEVQDLRDAVAYMPHRVTVRGGDFSDLGVCDVIVNSVGKIDLLKRYKAVSFHFYDCSFLCFGHEIVVPKGMRESLASLKHCLPTGMPTIVIHQRSPRRRYPIAISQPKRTIQRMFTIKENPPPP